MISRVADYCFWFGRYLERIESAARVLTVTRAMALDAHLTEEQAWLPVLIVSGIEPEFIRLFGKDAIDGERVQEFVSWSDENFSSIRRSIAGARENARSIRELISTEVWVAINELHNWMKGETARIEFGAHRYDFYRRVREAVALCIGLMRSTMLHDTPLDFIRFGILLERANQTGRILDVQHHMTSMLASTHPVLETSLWISLLRACSGFEPFMKRNRGLVSGSSVAAFLILEPKFPRSVSYSVQGAFERLCAIRPPTAHHLPGGQSIERLRVLKTWLDEQTPQQLAGPGAVHEVLTHVVDETQRICDGVGRDLFGYETGSFEIASQ